LTGNNTNVATFNGAALYRTSKAIYFAGLTPKSLNVVGYDALQSRSVTISNTCGMANLKYREMPTSIKVGGNTYTPATMSMSSSSLFYSCTSPGYAALAANTLYKINGQDYVYKTADLSLKRIVLEHASVVSKNIPVNACGFAVIPSLNTANGFTAGDKVTINGSTPYDVMSLPLATEAPICKNGAIYLVAP
jgi:Cu/Ag efflux protein CusF